MNKIVILDKWTKLELFTILTDLSEEVIRKLYDYWTNNLRDISELVDFVKAQYPNSLVIDLYHGVKTSTLISA